MKRYEIRWVILDPARGTGMAKTRPAVIVSLDILNERLQTVTVCPLTSALHPNCALACRCDATECPRKSPWTRSAPRARLEWAIRLDR